MPYVMLIFLAVVWGTSFGAIKVGVETIPPVSLATARVVIGAVLLYLFVLIRGRRLPRGWPVWHYCFWIGVFGNALPFALIAWGEVYIDSGLAAILMAVMPLATLMLAHFFTADETMNGPRIIGVVLGLSGVVVLIGFDALAGLGEHVLGQLAVAGGAVCYAIGAIITRRMPPSDPTERSAAMTICASLLIVPVALVVDGPDIAVPSTDSLIALVYLGVFATAAASIVYFALVAARGVTFFSFINYLIPAVGVLWGLAFLGEQVSVQSIVALGLIISGIAIANRSTKAVQESRPAAADDDRNR